MPAFNGGLAITLHLLGKADMPEGDTLETKDRPPRGWRKKYTLLTCVFGVVLACGFLYAKYQAQQVQPLQEQEVLDNALINAINKNNPSDVASLLRMGANPNGHQINMEPAPSTVYKIKPPLLRHFAALFELRRYHRSSSEQTALHESLSQLNYTNQSQSPYRVPSNVAIVTLLVQAGADVNAVGSSGWIPLAYAASTKQCDLVALLLDHGARVNKGGHDQCSTLAIAVANGDVPTVTLLIHRGADVNHADDVGCTPLMRAAQGGHEKVVHMLLNAGASVSPRNCLGWDALKCALDNDHAAIAQLLKTHSDLPARSTLLHVKK